MGAQLESELEAARRAAHPGDLKGKETELQRAKEEARRLGEERAKAQKARPLILFVVCFAACSSSLCCLVAHRSQGLWPCMMPHALAINLLCMWLSL